MGYSQRHRSDSVPLAQRAIAGLHGTLARHRAVVIAMSLIALAVALRFALILNGWPATDSDEATMGLMARHIAFNGERPIFFYGQNYMGALEAYLAAPFFIVFGSSLVALRVGLILLFAIVLITLFALARRLYGAMIALAALAFLTFGSVEILFRELEAVGGAMETLVFGALAFWLVVVVVATPAKPTRRDHIQRLGIYLALGLCVGLGLWSHLLVVPYVAGAGAVLWWWNRAELRGPAGALLAIGGCLGALPLLAYNLTAPAGTDSLHALLSVVVAGGTGASPTGANLGRQIVGMFVVTLPIATGANAVCAINPSVAWPLSATMSDAARFCSAAHGVWGSIVALLLGFETWNQVRTLRAHPVGRDRATAIRASVRLALSGAAWVTIALVALSPAPALAPWPSSRYLIGLLLAIPALFAAAADVTRALARRAHLGAPLSLSKMAPVFLLPILCAIVGTVTTARQIPAARRNTARFANLIQTLESRHITYIFSDYWTCDRIMFLTNEHIICGVIDSTLNAGNNRIPGLFDKIVGVNAEQFVFPRGFSHYPIVSDRYDYYAVIHTETYEIYLWTFTSAMLKVRIAHPQGIAPPGRP